MFNRKTIVAVLAAAFFVIGTGFGETLEDNWNDFLHYTKIGRLDLAKGYAKAVLQSNPDPVELLALSKANPQGYAILLKVTDSAADAELAELSGKILAIVERGTYIRRADVKLIVEEIKRLSGTSRGKLAAVKRLQDSGEYTVKYMLEAMVDDGRKDERPNIVWALPQIGKEAIRPLAAALQTKNMAVKAEIIKALGKIGYPQSLAYLKYVIEKENSPELQALAEQSILQIDPAALRLPAAQLFYRLAENYYYHAQSLAPVEDADLSNIWFWDADNQELIWKKVDKRYFNELMAMRSCEWALKADVEFGPAIGLWQGAYFKAESTGVDMPDYFGAGHPVAMVYATTAGPEYLHQALARAVKDGNAYVALGAVEALAVTAGEKSLFSRIGPAQPLVKALVFNDKAVRYSAAVAIASAGPDENFPESTMVARILAQAISETDDAKLTNKWVSESYSLRAAKVMLKLAQRQNSVIDLSVAEGSLINATKDSRVEIQELSAQILARLNSPQAQSAIAAMALDETNDMTIRISAFGALAVSAKFNGSLLADEAIDAIYSLLSSKDVDAQLRSAAATAFGALNLPSRKVKNLILDQAKS